MELTPASLLVLLLDVPLHFGHELVHAADLGAALGTLDHVVWPCRTIDREGAGAALTALQDGLVSSPVHESIGDQSSKRLPRQVDKIVRTDVAASHR